MLAHQTSQVLIAHVRGQVLEEHIGVQLLALFTPYTYRHTCVSQEHTANASALSCAMLRCSVLTSIPCMHRLCQRLPYTICCG